MATKVLYIKVKTERGSNEYEQIAQTEESAKKKLAAYLYGRFEDKRGKLISKKDLIKRMKVTRTYTRKTKMF